MKRPDQSWIDYLNKGIVHMEGTTAGGARSFGQAVTIFEECAEQKDDLTVKAEAHFRRAQVAHYQQQFDVARQWINSGKGWLGVTGSSVKQAQCRLIEGIVLEDERHLPEAMIVYGELWEMEFSDQKLRGDIANRMARAIIAHYGNAGIREACEWIIRAEKCFSSIENPDDSVYHALAAVKGRAALFLHRRSHELWKETDQLFAEGKARDPFIRAIYWLNRCKFAFSSLQPLRTLWFFLHFLWSYKDCKK